jgi:hypothetical protein
MKRRKIEEIELKLKKEQTDQKLQVVTLGYTSGGIVKQK